MDSSKYTTLYLQEARKTLERMHDLVHRGPAGGDLEELFRLAHNLKGMSSAMGRQSVVSAAHELEDLLAPFKKGNREGSIDVKELVSALDRVVLAVEADVSELARDREETPRVERNMEIRFMVDKADPSGMKIVKDMVSHIGKRGSVLAVHCRTRPGHKPFRRGILVVILVRTSSSMKELLDAVQKGGHGGKIEVAPAPDLVSGLSSPRPKPSTIETMTVDFTSWSRVDELIQELAQRAGEIRGIRKDVSLQAKAGELLSKIESLHAEAATLPLCSIKKVFKFLPAAARGAAREQGKQVALNMEVEDMVLRVDVAEKLREPMVHMVRNAVAHGIETTVERKMSGKPVVGRLTIGAARKGSRMRLWVEDDGKGIDRQGLVHKAREMGVADTGTGSGTTGDDMARLAFVPGLSTKESADTVSGRGMGLNSVMTVVQSLGGEVVVESEPGVFTRFTLWLPGAVFSEELLVLEERGSMFCIPKRNVGAVASYPGPNGFECVQPARLSALLGISDRKDFHGSVIIVEIDEGSVALMVDKVLEMGVAVVKPLARPLSMIDTLMGHTRINGRSLLVLDPEGIFLRSHSPVQQYKSEARDEKK